MFVQNGALDIIINKSKLLRGDFLKRVINEE